jgi:hypothetical protein
MSKSKQGEILNNYELYFNKDHIVENDIQNKKLNSKK